MKRNIDAARRRGTVIVCVLACLVIGSMLAATTMQAALQGRREVRLQRQLRQTELLCEAGVIRAAQQLTQSADYTGEEWRPALDIPAFFDAQVVITVDNIQDSPVLQITVVARLDSSSDNDGPMQRSHTFNTIASTPSHTENQP